MPIRPATREDMKRMVELSDVKRTEYAEYSPIFWRKAAGASEKQEPFFEAQLEREANIVLVAEQAGEIDGFLIASLVDAPPVYDPGGKVCIIDDFAVSTPDGWQTIGQALLSEATMQAKARGRCCPSSCAATWMSRNALCYERAARSSRPSGM